ncbi:hypothetical protein F5Y15DRAFT_18638 [Xylariaceae sp. FL0016]|nr:hypothetical protein F5Y15DRAFT_18638 [Xylariaceae sp. FL0016]
MTSTATTLSQQQQQQQQPQQQQKRPQHHTLSRSSRKPGSSGIATASTPNLSSLYSVHSRLAPGASTLARKASIPALTPNSLAAIPDDSEGYAIHSVLNQNQRKMPPTTPGRGAGPAEKLSVGDTVDVPGNLSGTVRFLGSVAGKKGIFAGVELHPEFASRGKNNGDVEGISYFSTTVPGSGIFVPDTKLSKRDSPPTSAASSFALTPSGNTLAGLKIASQNATNHTPPTPSISKFSQSMGPPRAASPQGKRSRPSLARPESPVRRLQLTPSSRPTIGTPASKHTARYGSPTTSRFASSVRGTAGDPNKNPRLERRPSIAPRSISALGQRSNYGDDDEGTSVGAHAKANGSVGSIASLGFKRPASRAHHANEEEIERLRSQLGERDRQLREQASALAEMESSLSELTVLIDQSDNGRTRSGSLDDKDSPQLRAMLREKNDKIAMLTTEFDAHRADFRSTIDTLEMASTETQRVYDARIRELEQFLQQAEARAAEAEDQHSDVNTVARQLKQLEEFVLELEEGLQDARRGEAEARGEVEFLRGEVERTRTQLRGEREKASAATNGDGSGGDRPSLSKELEQKEDEIRGLKAIIHSLSRDSIPGSESPEKTPTQPQRNNSFTKAGLDSVEGRSGKDNLEREVFELRGLLDSKNAREEELEREIETLRRPGPPTHRDSSMTIRNNNRSSYRDSKGTVVLAPDTRSPETGHKRAHTLDTMPESDAYSSVTESSTLWCEICETGGHDILTCTNMFGPQNEQGKSVPGNQEPGKMDKDVNRKSAEISAAQAASADEDKPRPLSPIKTKTVAQPPPASVQILPNPTDSGPLAGKESGEIDLEKWCALCERDGHDSIDCPLEDAF